GRSALNTAFVDANINASYHQGASQFTLIYTPSWRNYQNVYDNITESFIGDGFSVDLDDQQINKKKIIQFITFWVVVPPPAWVRPPQPQTQYNPKPIKQKRKRLKRLH
ncbi:MAG: hypothetical protein K2K45_05505, partial [Muribaculaceae bacterium]|nr:hypothetical protein [Muribaculaceae bacterium]